MMAHYDVIIPAWNAQSTILETLQSIAAQTIKPTKIIVVDDGSTDDTRAVVVASNLANVVITIENQGPGAATTRGFSELESDYVAFCDADDIWLPHKSDAQLRYLETNPKVDAVLCDTAPFRDIESGRQFGTPQKNWGRTVLMMKRQALHKIGVIIDPTGKRGELVDWITRGRELGIIFDYIHDVFAYRRISSTSLSYERSKQKDFGYLQVAHAALMRKRLRGETV